MALWMVIATPVFTLVALAVSPFPPKIRTRAVGLWSLSVVAVARAVCGIRHKVIGAERLPKPPYVILSKHQSAWETLAYHGIFPPQVYLLKRELLRIPFFGWGLATMSPIAIDRTGRRAALAKLAQEGGDRLRKGFCVVVFPEGTRVPPGERRRFALGGAWLAEQSGVPAVPVAVDSGRCWPRNAFIKRPGTVTVSIGEPIVDGSAADISAAAEQWIETEMGRLEGRPADKIGGTDKNLGKP